MSCKSFVFSVTSFLSRNKSLDLLKRSLLQRLNVLAASGITFVHWVLQRDSVWDLSPCQGCVGNRIHSVSPWAWHRLFALMPCPDSGLSPKHHWAWDILKICSITYQTWVQYSWWGCELLLLEQFFPVPLGNGVLLLCLLVLTFPAMERALRHLSDSTAEQDSKQCKILNPFTCPRVVLPGA